MKGLNEQQFKKLLIDTVKVGDHPEKEQVISLLKISIVRFEKTGEFTRRLWNHYKEYIYLCIIPEKIIELKKYEKYLNGVCDEIYPPDDEYEFWSLLIRPGSLPVDEEISQEILFEGIQQQIIEEIRSAKYLIWIAMAWFTDPVLFKELLKKKAQGVTIEIVMDDNEKNRNAEFDLSTSFPTHWVRIESLYKNIMHEKFCIIDLNTVIHGTFNWTKAANYNKETISIDRNRITAEAFADEFMKLKKSELLKF
ncbi:MAG: phospholipase D-like domain-containing protein [Saccharofermentanales bacterium]